MGTSKDAVLTLASEWRGQREKVVDVYNGYHNPQVRMTDK